MLELFAQAADLLVAAFQFGLERLCWRIVGAADERGEYVLKLVIFAEMLQRTLAAHRFNAAHSGRDAAFPQNLQQTDLAGGCCVRAAAEFS